MMTCESAHEEILVCPRCGDLACASCGLCNACGVKLPSDGTVLTLLNTADPFYEGVYQAQTHLPESALSTLRGRVLLPFITYGYLQAIVRHVAKGTRLLELGCGSGLQLAATRYRVTAVELSLGSLQSTPKGYKHRIQVDATKVDFRPGSFDAVAASCFWEHLTSEQKDVLLKKISCWLQPGGVLILLFDTASESPFFRWLRRYPELYQKCLVEHDGHVGLELVSVNRARLRRFGFQEMEGVGLNRTWQHLPVYSWIVPYREMGRLADVVSRFGVWIYQRPRLSQVFTGALHLWDLSVGRLFPLDWSRLYLGVWRRKADDSDSNVARR